VDNHPTEKYVENNVIGSVINIACHHRDATWNIDQKKQRQVWNLKKHNHIRDPDNISLEMIK